MTRDNVKNSGGMPPPRVFDIISSHSNFNPNSNSKLNSKIKNKKVFLFFVGLHLAANIPNNVIGEAQAALEVAQGNETSPDPVDEWTPR